MANATKNKVFISYRRDDSAETVARLYDRLVARFGIEAIFKDVDSIPYGADFVRYIRSILAQCAVQLAVIGPRWLDIALPDGRRRLDDPGDFVRLEIEAALAQNIPIIPVLVQGAGVPPAARLPESLRGMVRHNGVPVRDVPDFEGDALRVLRAVEGWLGGAPPPPIAANDVVLRLLEEIRQAFNDGDWLAVIRKADLLIRTRPDAAGPDIYRMLGLALLARDESARASEALETALKAQPHDVPTLRAAAQARLRMGQPSRAVPLLNDALALVSERTERIAILDEYARVTAALAQWSELLAASDEALGLTPEEPENWRGVRAQALVQLGRTQEAVEAGRGIFAADRLPARLAQLGLTPRKRQGTEMLVPPVVPVAEGEFLMGSDKRKDTQAYDDELPQHRVTLPTYQIAKFPVTVAEYACFVRAGQAQPGNWQQQLQHPDHSVVYISWREAVAYTAWLAKLTGQPWRLPTEAEWEKAARGTDGRIYPWGDQWDKSRCNSSESGIGTTTPVGNYPTGASPCGALDMTGNVWEWTSSLYTPYPYSHDSKHEDPNSTGNRVLRGGSWYNAPRRCRAAYRFNDDPGTSNVNGGFRVVLVAAPGS